MSFLLVDSRSVHYADEGPRDAPALVFVNALGSDFRIWDAVALQLASHFREIRYDKRGHGLSANGPDHNDMADYAADLAGLLDALGVARATVVGLSIGGLIAQEFYRLYPQRVAALVLSDTAAKIGDDESWDARVAEIERGGVEAIADGVLERWFTADFRQRRKADLAGWRAMLTRTPKQGYLAACGALKRADLRPYANRIEAPTLCLVGEEDGSTPVAMVRETASLIGHAKFEIIPRAGHIPGLEQPDAVAALIAGHARG